MADYPDWVLMHKKKGTYVNKVGDKYYLYAAHSERVPGTKKVKRVCDGYLGRITQAEGLIPPKKKPLQPVAVYEYGLSSLTFSLCGNIHKGLRRKFVRNGDFIMAASILTFVFGFFSEELFRHSWLSLRFPELSFQAELTLEQQQGIQRANRMVADVMLHTFSTDLAAVRASFSLVQLVSINQTLACAILPASIDALISQYHLEWRADLWQR